MDERILFVDDDPHLLASCERTFRRRFRLETAEGGEAGLAKLAQGGAYAVVIADRQMPGMDGIQFLSLVRQRAPDTIRMMLTGNADLEAAIRVVNEGNIFRFLTKPCPPEPLGKAIDDALGQYRLVVAEKELLSRTLTGSIKLLTDILSANEPESYGRAQAQRETISSLTGKLQIPNAWEIHLALMLAPIGYVTIPPETLVKFRKGQALSEQEQQMLAKVPEIAASLLANIPRLQGVAHIVRYQNKHFDGAGFPVDDVAGDSIPIGARLLKILLDKSACEERGLSRFDALKELEASPGHYDPILLSALRAHEVGDRRPNRALVRLSIAKGLKELEAGMVLRSNVETVDGTLILTAGHRLSEMTLERIRNFHSVARVKEPIMVEQEEMTEAIP